MKITIYELLGLVKDDKAPEKIKYKYSIYELTPEKDEYYCKNEMRWFTNEIDSLGVLNDYVEIIEEDKEIEKIEIVNNGNMNAYAIYSADGAKCALTKHSKVMCDKINELIDKVNSLKNKQ